MVVREVRVPEDSAVVREVLVPEDSVEVRVPEDSVEARMARADFPVDREGREAREAREALCGAAAGEDRLLLRRGIIMGDVLGVCCPFLVLPRWWR